MIKNKAIIFIIILVVLYTLPIITQARNENPSTILELDNLNQIENIVTLDGKWEFYWNQLLEPNAFKNSNLKPDGIVDIPGAWNGQTYKNNAYLEMDMPLII